MNSSAFAQQHVIYHVKLCIQEKGGHERDNNEVDKLFKSRFFVINI